ncbi:haloacid dehalogenase type II [Oerskovia flava]|uniref:haloacid dehalogenase type II n=1 Tax=Oerskovia flava TaxID=2986422 RepID=UPI002AD59542|nr:haloacid dehalogenase type II [Oerskovia sp. JB1-3-2]
MAETSARTLLLLSLLQARRDWSGPALAERLGVDPRTVRRDVERLRELGYRITASRGPDGGYRLDAGAELPPLLFDDEQVVALTVALQTLAASGVGAELEEAAARALTTLRQVMPTRLRHRVDAVQVTTVPPGSGSAPRVDVEVLLAVSAAVRAREVLRLDYTSPGARAEPDAVPLRRVEPHHVVVSGGRWYLVAWDLDRDDWRTFRVDRLTPRTPTGPRFTPRALPGGDVRSFVTSRFRGADTAGAWPCLGEAVLAAPATRVAPFVADGVVEHLGPDRCRVVLGSWSWTALAASIGVHDVDVESAAPPELVDAFARLAQRYRHAADSSSDDAPAAPGEDRGTRPSRQDDRRGARMPPIHDIEVVVVDVLGTLVDEPSGLRAAIREALPRADDAFVDTLLDEWQRYVALQQLRIAQGHREYASSEVVDDEAARDLAARAGITVPATIRRLATAGQRLPPWHDSVAGLDRLAQQMPVVALSNASSAALLRLNVYAGLRWHVAASGETTRVYKPAPEIYRYAVDVAGCPAERVLMVAAHAWDLRGAQAQGMRTAYVRRPVGDPPASSDVFDGQFDGLEDLVAALTPLT